MKNAYESVQIEVIVLDCNDIIVSSDTVENPYPETGE